MPVLNTRFGGGGETPDGKLVQVLPTVALCETGPLIQVSLMPLDSRIQALADEGKEITPVNGNALIDTGARTTCIDQKAVERAGLSIVDTGTISSATHAQHEVPIFAGKLDFVALSSAVNAPRAYGVNLESQNIIALIGRDVLQMCVLIYNGPDGSFSLSV